MMKPPNLFNIIRYKIHINLLKFFAVYNFNCFDI